MKKSTELYKVLRLSDPTNGEIKEIKRISGKYYNDYHYKLLKDNTIRKGIYFLADKPIDHANPVTLDQWDEEPLNPQCYYEEPEYSEYPNFLLTLINQKRLSFLQKIWWWVIFIIRLPSLFIRAKKEVIRQ